MASESLLKIVLADLRLVANSLRPGHGPAKGLRVSKAFVALIERISRRLRAAEDLPPDLIPELLLEAINDPVDAYKRAFELSRANLAMSFDEMDADFDWFLVQLRRRVDLAFDRKMVNVLQAHYKAETRLLGLRSAFANAASALEKVQLALDKSTPEGVEEANGHGRAVDRLRSRVSAIDAFYAFTLSYRGFVHPRLRSSFDKLSTHPTLGRAPSHYFSDLTMLSFGKDKSDAAFVSAVARIQNAIEVMRKEAVYDARVRMIDILRDPLSAAFALVEDLEDRLVRGPDAQFAWDKMLEFEPHVTLLSPATKKARDVLIARQSAKASIGTIAELLKLFQDGETDPKRLEKYSLPRKA